VGDLTVRWKILLPFNINLASLKKKKLIACMNEEILIIDLFISNYI